jgi:hypothetical protein
MEGDDDNKPAHIFLRSIHHIPIERGWLDLRCDFGHNFPHFWAAGANTYEENNLTHWCVHSNIQRHELHLTKR